MAYLQYGVDFSTVEVEHTQIKGTKILIEASDVNKQTSKVVVLSKAKANLRLVDKVIISEEKVNVRMRFLDKSLQVDI